MSTFKGRNELLQTYLQHSQKLGLDVKVLMDGPITSDIAFVGEYPGDQETRMGKPFTGGVGQVLWSTLAKYNYNKLSCYTTHTVKKSLHRDNDVTSKVTINQNEKAHWEGLLQWELAQLPNLRTIVVLGEMALHAVTGKSSIEKWRGSVLKCEISLLSGESKSVNVLCMYNPSLTIKMPKTEVIFKYDMAKLPLVISGQWRDHEIDAVLNPSKEVALSWIQDLYDADKPISFDIEVLNHEVACIGFANNAHSGICINFRNADDNVYSIEDEREIIVAIQKLFDKPGVRLIAQNGTFDTYYLAMKNRINVPRIWMDTLLAHHTLYSQLPHSLAFLVSQYTTHSFYKDEGKCWRDNDNINEFWLYNVKDACLTWACHEKILHELVSEGMDKFFFNHVMMLQPILIKMTILGIHVDNDLKEELVRILGDRVETLKEDFYKAVIECTNDPKYRPSPNSPKQLQELFFDRLHLVGRGTSTDEANRAHIKQHRHTNDTAKHMLNCLDKYKEEAKFYSTYATMRLCDNKKLHTEWKQSGTTASPGRLSSCGLDFLGIGGNAQNLPRRIQPIIVAPRGRMLVYFDLAQAEARVVAWEAKILKWQEQFEKARLEGGYDCHRALASEMWGIPYDDVPTSDVDKNGKPSLRFVAKRCRHGLNYRMQEGTLAETTGLSQLEAQAAFEKYHRVTPELAVWWKTVENEVKENKKLYNAKGRRLVFMERITTESTESIIAFKPQSLIGDHVCEVMYRCNGDPDWPISARFILNIHDALIAECQIEDHMVVAKIMKKYAETPIYIHSKPLIIPADFKISQPTTWDIDENGDVVYTPNSEGLHRFYMMKKLTF